MGTLLKCSSIMVIVQLELGVEYHSSDSAVCPYPSTLSPFILTAFISCFPAFLRMNWEILLSGSNREMSLQALRIFRTLSNLL